MMVNFSPINPETRINVSGLISGDETRNDIIAPSGKALLSSEITTAMVPQAHSGVSAAISTLAGIT